MTLKDSQDYLVSELLGFHGSSDDSYGIWHMAVGQFLLGQNLQDSFAKSPAYDVLA